MSEDLYMLELEQIVEDYRNEDYGVFETLKRLGRMGFKDREAHEMLRDEDADIYEERLSAETAMLILKAGTTMGGRTA